MKLFGTWPSPCIGARVDSALQNKHFLILYFSEPVSAKKKKKKKSIVAAEVAEPIGSVEEVAKTPGTEKKKKKKVDTPAPETAETPSTEKKKKKKKKSIASA